MRQLGRAIRAELAKLSWRSGIFWAAIPLSIVIPVVITGGIAAAQEYISNLNSHAGPDEVVLPGGYSMTPDNTVYWVLFLSTFVMACAAVNSYGSEVKNRTTDAFGYIQPCRWTLLTAKLVVFGVLGALTTFVGVIVINGVFPHVFTTIWADITVFSPQGIRFLWSIPLYTFALVGLGLGLVALIRSTFMVVALLLFVKLGTEAFLTVGDPDTADDLRHYSPFLNAEYSTGQTMGVPDGMWGPSMAIAYYGVIFGVVFLVGVWRSARVPRR